MLDTGTEGQKATWILGCFVQQLLLELLPFGKGLTKSYAKRAFCIDPHTWVLLKVKIKFLY